MSDDAADDVLLAVEVVVERRLGDVQLFGDLAHRGGFVALVGEELQRHGQDPGVRARRLRDGLHGGGGVAHDTTISSCLPTGRIVVC